MGRGKYGSSAEATAARNSAISEAEAGRRQIAALSAAVHELRTTLSQEREANTATLRHMNALLAEGSAPEVEVLRARLRDAEHDKDRIRAELTHGITVLFQKYLGNRYAPKFLADMAELLGVPLLEMIGEPGSRSARRKSGGRFASEMEGWSPTQVPGRPPVTGKSNRVKDILAGIANRESS